MMKEINEALAFIKSKGTLQPETGIILGTGLGSLVNAVDIEYSIPYTDIPHFPLSTVESHKGELIFGYIGNKPVVVMHGRFHFYEGYTMQQITLPVRVMKLLGIKRLLISNAAGGLNEGFTTSNLMLITDHINLMPENPLTGQNIDALGDRFPDMSEPYDLELIQLAKIIAEEENILLHEGVYVGVIGPNLETKAEYKFLRLIGADAVGMSTIPEVIVARHMNLSVMAVSVITDLCSPGNVKKVNIAEILHAAALAEPKLVTLFKAVVSRV